MGFHLHDAIKHLGSLGFYLYNISSWPNVFSLHFSQQCLGLLTNLEEIFERKTCFIDFSVTGARVQSQSEQIWMYNRYEIVMEYAKRPRLPPPFVVISYISINHLLSSHFLFILFLFL